MEHKKAIEIFLGMLDKRFLNAKEKEAVRTAIGVLDWMSTGKKMIKNKAAARKAKIEKIVKM